MSTYVHSNVEVIWAMKRRFNISDHPAFLQVLRDERVLRSDNTGNQTWPIPDDIELS